MINFEELIKSLILPLVVYPQDITIDSNVDENEQLYFNIFVNDSDIGRIIGRNGTIINAIRTIIYAAASKEGKRVHLNVDTNK